MWDTIGLGQSEASGKDYEGNDVVKLCFICSKTQTLVHAATGGLKFCPVG
ncbi:hypothetical protein AG1IA_05989 [Rhizoctonia solani AG-1 IA]|uniref:Uncharacterized protein n=1 Tax=Thanatephorus cucumeris (strain AG1-IA) TaxID=983506 RepID=L8WPQ9_THACA|nr:hypothetical protein AG1IA_05989 [Rhizoctonia solani AG-1 IA]